jgi:hypothetical protein
MQQLTQQDAISFITGGNAIFTLKSLKTQTRFTYKVYYDKSNFIVYVLTGNDNTANYSYMCHIIPDTMEMKKITNSKFTPNSTAYVAFEYVFYNLLTRQTMPKVEIWQSGRCCRCGRLLTVPESIESGIGPECAGKERRFAL